MGTNIEMTAASLSPRPGTRPVKRVVWLGLLIIVSALVAGFAVWPLSPTNLGKGREFLEAKLYERWSAGEVVVLVRHAERCDRSSGACLGPADGITSAGRDVAASVGAAFMTLGMENANVMASPLTRTAQTAQAMFHQAAQEQDWLVNCDIDMARDIKAHKVAGQNLVLVTHSGCLTRLESDLGFPHAKDPEYTSSLFATVGSNGKLKVLGVINPQDWALVTSRKSDL